MKERRIGSSNVAASGLLSQLETSLSELSSMRMRVLQGLADRGEDEAWLRAADQVLAGDPSPVARAAVVALLARAHPHARTPLLARALADPDPDVRRAAVAVLTGDGAQSRPDGSPGGPPAALQLTTPTDRQADDATVQESAPTAEWLAPERPRLAEGMELLGEYKDSGFTETRYLIRLSDGDVIQLSRLLYLVAGRLDGERDLQQVAAAVGEDLGRRVSAANIAYLIDEKLKPLGLIAEAPQTTVTAPPPLLSLGLRIAVVPKRLVHRAARVLSPLFLPTVVIAVLAGVVAFDVWLFFFHGIGASLERVLSEPLLLLALVGLTLVSAAFHELGHAAACCYGGGQPGPIGVGIYVLWPAFFSDVTDSYRLSKGGRLRTDLGGLYFNGVFVVAIAGAYFATKFEPLLLLAVVQHVMVLEQLLPFVRLDGYYVLSDLSGVPDPFQRVRPVLKSLLRGSEGRRAVADLKPRVRAVITGWIFLTVPVLAATVGVFVAKGPPYVVASWDSLVSQAQNLGHALEEGQLVTGLLVAVQVLALAIPLAGIALIVLRVFRRIRNRALSLLFVILVAALIARVPIRERQTATQLAASVTTGSCSLDEKTDPGRLHVKSPSYAVDPPSGGDHHRVPAKPGIYAAPDAPPDGELVHSQEHGYVVLWYSPQLPDHEMATLLSVAHRFRKDVLVIPRPSLQVQVAATAWHRRLLCGRVEAAALATFIETYRNKGPERIPHSSQPREASKTNEEGSEGVGSAPDSTAPQREDHDSAQPRLQPPRLGADRIGCRHLLCDPTGANRVTS